MTPELEENIVFCPQTPEEAVIVSPTGEVTVFIVLTTKRLLALGHATRPDGVLPWCVDATYKVCCRDCFIPPGFGSSIVQCSTLGYAVMALGVCDAQKTGEPFAIALTNKEDMEAYCKLFRTVRAASGSEVQPTHIVHDTAPAIFNAVAAELLRAVSVLCFFHVMQTIKRWKSDYAKGLEAADKQFILRNVSRIHDITSKPDADLALSLFLQAMRERSAACIRWVEGWAPTHAVRVRRTWILAYTEGCPTTVRRLFVSQ
jgi:hypothetical protein